MREDTIRNGLESGYRDRLGSRSCARCSTRWTPLWRRHDWLVGDRLTLADCAMVPIVLRLGEFGLAPAWERSRPNIAAWWARVAERPTLTRLLDLADQALLTQLTGAMDDVRGEVLAALA